MWYMRHSREATSHEEIVQSHRVLRVVENVGESAGEGTDEEFSNQRRWIYNYNNTATSSCLPSTWVKVVLSKTVEGEREQHPNIGDCRTTRVPSLQSRLLHSPPPFQLK